ncbi:hypothetical protein [Variovorax sp. MHTC-1]|uniref:hypothetical protein n=1 Tax=Variovorax sp. MHTC-1 TaxID=2495593 RepID=UPI000F864E15|nr:hypothetical protein [Variovorax sp. MHTC-1]RST52648.1 hypothetical protein EJI01_15685 [Variovorax sp. MHTC-1]
MAEKKRPVFYANFICHFGARELLHYFEQIVAPAFLTDNSRTYKDKAYFFHDVQLINLGSRDQPEWAIGGNFVKSMIVRSEQRYDQQTNTLRPANESMETAPSAVFVLLLRSHKLIYMLKTGGAPAIESFRSTALHFIAKARLDFINRLYRIAQENEDDLPEEVVEAAKGEDDEPVKVTKKRLQEIVEAPELEVVPLANDDSLREFIKRFKVLRSATVQLLKPNSELDNDDFFEAFRDRSEDVKATQSTIIYRNKEGLAKAKVATQLESVAGDGNSQIRLEGIDANDQKLRGSNDEFKIVSLVDPVDRPLPATITHLGHLFKQQVANGAIKLAPRQPNPGLDERLAGSIARIRAQSNDDET